MYPQHLIDLAEEAFDVYLSKSPEAKEAWEKFVEAVTEHLTSTGSNVTVEEYTSSIAQFLMER